MLVAPYYTPFFISGTLPMQSNSKTRLVLFAAASCVLLAVLTARGGWNEAAEKEAKDLPDMQEARARARLLQETIHATLQIVHHRYYREDEGLPIPALTMKTVFAELAQHRCRTSLAGRRRASDEH